MGGIPACLSQFHASPQTLTLIPPPLFPPPTPLVQVAQRLHSLARMREREEMSGLQAKMLLALTGMPARGKSFIARKLHVFLNWSSVESAVFNVGKYRRDLAGAGASDFFDPSNQEAAVLRETAAMTALDDALAFLDDGGQAAIFDATNTTRERRKTIYDRVKAHDNRIGVVFIEVGREGGFIFGESTHGRETRITTTNTS